MSLFSLSSDTHHLSLPLIQNIVQNFSFVSQPTTLWQLFWRETKVYFKENTSCMIPIQVDVFTIKSISVLGLSTISTWLVLNPFIKKSLCFQHTFQHTSIYGNWRLPRTWRHDNFTLSPCHKKGRKAHGLKIRPSTDLCMLNTSKVKSAEEPQTRGKMINT